MTIWHYVFYCIVFCQDVTGKNAISFEQFVGDNKGARL